MARKRHKNKNQKQAEQPERPGAEADTPAAEEQREIPFAGDAPQSNAAANAEAGETSEPMAPASDGADAATDLMVPRAMLAEAETQRDQYLEVAKRAQADLENYRKRVQKERADLKRDSLGFFLREVLPQLHDMDRVLAEGEKSGSDDHFLQGVRLVRENLWKALEKVGVNEIAALGEPFDPNVHEALTTMPSAEHDPNTVIEVFQPGYRLEEFVLAPARVVVSAAPA